MSHEDRISRERDLLLELLQLAFRREPEDFVQEALRLIAEAMAARHGYLEIRSSAEPEEPHVFWKGYECSNQDIDTIRSRISSGIVAHALVSGRTILTHCAREDVRFSGRESVAREAIDAVLCAPIEGSASRGVIYLQNVRHGRGFSEQDRQLAELFAELIAPQVDHLFLAHQTRAKSDATQDVRSRIQAKNLVGVSKALANVLQRAAMVAPLDLSVLITGENGTGKTHLARVLHANSERSAGPLVEVSCSALPPTLIHAELFGAEPGAYTDLKKLRRGRIAGADGGTLFLDEIGELPLECQATLLQLLEDRQIARVGSDEVVGIDVRIIAATNVDLQEAMRAGRFRKDLFFRLADIEIRMPALRERREDIPELAHVLCRQICGRLRVPELELSTAAVRALSAQSWEGNVRQLAKTVQVGVVNARWSGASRIDPEHLFPEQTPTEQRSDDRTLDAVLARTRRAHILEVLEDTAWNIAEAARQLGCARGHLYDLMKSLGIRRPD